MLEIYMEAVENKSGDSFLEEVNLGVGNYSDGEYWQQVESFRNGLYADTAMTQKIVERARLQTQRRLVDAIYGDGDDRILRHIDYPDPEESGTPPKKEYLENNMEEIWQGLGYESRDGESYSATEHQAWLVHVCTGLGTDWTPPHWSMMMARHEASRSKGARMLDNLFGRPPEPDNMQPMEDFQ